MEVTRYAAMTRKRGTEKKKLGIPPSTPKKGFHKVYDITTAGKQQSKNKEAGKPTKEKTHGARGKQRVKG